MYWARRLKRVFGIEIEQCVRCGGRPKVIASIEEPELIERILEHIKALKLCGDVGRDARTVATRPRL